MFFTKSQLIARRDFLKGTALTTASLIGPAIGVAPGVSAEQGGKRADCLESVYRQLHIDAHLAACEHPYEGFDAGAAAQTIFDAGFQMVCYFGVCVGGYSYYPSRIGVVHPGLTRDFTGEMTAALKKHGICTIVYMRAGWDRHYGKTNPEWIASHDPARQTGAATSDGAEMCLNSPWVDRVQIPQMKEVVSRYDVDGLFIDLAVHQFITANCYCKYCRDSFGREVGGAIPVSDGDAKAFAYRKWVNRRLEAYIEKVHRALDDQKPGVIIVHNWAWMTRCPLNPPAHVRHINWDTPTPNMSVYALDFSFEARYLSTLGDRSWAFHNTRGNSWGDYALREEAAFMQEVATELAAGGRSLLSDDAYPSGNPEPAVYERHGRVNERTLKLEPFLRGCRPVKDVAVLHSADTIFSKTPMKLSPEWKAGPAYYPVSGAHKVLIEGHVEMNILNSQVLADALGQYRSLILPDQRILSDRECDAVRGFVRDGGSLLATCATGTRNASDGAMADFALADVLGVRYRGLSAGKRSFLRLPFRIESFGVPRMDVQVNGEYARVEATTAKALLELVPAEVSKQAPASAPQGPGVTLNQYGKGQALYCAAPLFSSYYAEGPAMLRRLALWMLSVVHPEGRRTIVLESTPPNVEVFYSERGKDRFVHLVNYSGDKRETEPSQSQECVRVHGIRVRANVPTRPKRVVSVPEYESIPCEWHDGWIRFAAHPLGIHAAYMIEG
jgi:hypothetical protein